MSSSQVFKDNIPSVKVIYLKRNEKKIRHYAQFNGKRNLCKESPVPSLLLDIRLEVMRKTMENHSKTQAEEQKRSGQIYHWGYMLYSVEHKRKGARLE
jgi:hypothetical protein